MTTQENPFDADVVDAVLRHMNTDHEQDSVVICRAFGGRPDATSATMIGLDGTGADFEVDGPSGVSVVRIAWAVPISERPEIRAEVARLFHEADALLSGG